MLTTRPSLVDGKPLGDLLLSRTIRNAGYAVSPADRERFTYVFILWSRVLQDLAVTYGLERCYTDANLSHWIDRPVIEVDILANELADITGVIRCYDPNMGPCGFRAYKAWLNTELRDNSCFELLRPMLYRLYGGSTTVFRDINTVTQFMQRMTFVDTSFMDTQLISDYLALEREMAAWVYPQTTLDVLRYIVTDWFRGFEIDGLKPFFSNGATAETRRGVGVAAKVLKGVRTIPLVLADTMISFQSPYYKDCFSLGQKPSAVFHTVPKSWLKRRGISFEPVVHQYYQSALFKGFDEWFKAHPRMRISLDDQESSRRLALEGSRWYNYSTIDLSSASDTVTWELVQELFRDSPDILRYMGYVRTETVIVNGRTVSLHKYAPMGSVLCFPVECIVFSAIASYACHLSGIPQLYRVYGDDIVIDSRAYQHACSLLEELHFSVNSTKSFGPSSCFLEACGMEAYRGADVTPCRISRRFDVKRIERQSPQQLVGSIEVINRLYEYGLLSARRMLVKDILRVYGAVPFSVNPAKGIYTPNPNNDHLKGRYNTDLQCLEYRVVELSTVSRKGNEDIRYVYTLEGIEQRLVSDPYLEGPLTCGSTRTSLREEWRTEWDLA